MFKKFICMAACLIAAFTFAACDGGSVKAYDLMRDINPVTVIGKASDEAFSGAAADFAVELFKRTASDKNNSLISPVSVLLALALAANGADGATLAQMEAVIGGGMNINEINEYLYSYVKSLPSGEKSFVNISNSMWFRDNAFIPNPEFLQTNANYYGASAYKSAFDSKTVKDINNWIKQETDGLIDKVIDKIPAETVLYLINTVLFDAEWRTVYEKHQVKDGVFTAVFDGKKKTTKFMWSGEYKFLEGDNVKGFLKPYNGGNYSFAALLPDEGVLINDYIASLSGEKFMNILKGWMPATVNAALPKFNYSYEFEMSGVLKAMGMADAFSPLNADFTKMGSLNGNLYLGSVLHKTVITVDERGTKAGAVTVIDGKATSGPPQEIKNVILDRPFVYAIIDNATMLPIFIGTVMSV